jgi:hypothetical protein
MPQTIPIGRTLRIRDCGLDEYWLQDQIFQNPGKLGLGDLEALSKEKSQSSGGRLDLLLKDPDDDSMYEVEVMLGDTDEKHIIRTIEYWDNERRKWPQRQHFAVLIAESITRRFFNVIQLLGQTVPIIAIQANITEADGSKILSFTKVLDVYEEPGEPGTDSDEPITEEDWRKKAPSTLEAAYAVAEVVKPICGQVSLMWHKYYTALRVSQNNYFSLEKRSGNKSRLGFSIDSADMDKVTTLLDEAGIAYVKKPKGVRIMTDKAAIHANAEAYRRIAEFVRGYWEG